MATQSQLAAIRLALNSLSDQAKAEFNAAVAQGLHREALLAAAVDIISRYGGASSAFGESMVAVWADELGIPPGASLPAQAVDAPRASSRLSWALNRGSGLGSALGIVDELVKQPFRSTIQDSAYRAHAGWARVPSGPETCKFCLLLASRGGVYHSEQFGINGQGYHGSCDCVPVLTRGPDDLPAGYDPAGLYDRYLMARADASSGSLTDVLSAWRKSEGGH